MRGDGEGGVFILSQPRGAVCAEAPHIRSLLPAVADSR